MYKKVVLLVGLSFLEACGGGSGNGTSSSSSSTAPTYTIAGTVNGLAGAGLVLQNNAGNDLPLFANDSFVFSAPVGSGVAYSVIIKTQPTATPAQTCAVTNGSGTVNGSNVTNVSVSCRNSVSKFLYSVNGSNITGFAINSSNGTLTPVPGSPFASSAPLSIIFKAPSSQFIYAVTSSFLSTGAYITPIAGYSVDANTGSLTSSFTNFSPAKNPNPASGLSFFGNANLSFLYQRSLNDGLQLAYSIDAPTGQLSLAPAANLTNTNAGVFDAQGKFYYVGITSPSISLEVYSVNALTGVRTLIGLTPTGQISLGTPVLDPTGKFLYLINAAPPRTLAGFTVNATSGLLTPIQTPMPIGSDLAFSLSMVMHPSGKFLYALEPNATPPFGTANIYVYSINQTTGVLTPVGSPVSTGGTGPIGMQVYLNGKFLVATNQSNASVAIFGIDQMTGALTPAQGSPFFTGGSAPSIINIDPSGRYAYLSDAVAHTITAFVIDQAAGTVTVMDVYQNASSGGIGGIMTFVGLQ